jgi:hypothetical protein
MTGTNCDLFTHKQSRSYLNHLVLALKICRIVTIYSHLNVLKVIDNVRESLEGESEHTGYIGMSENCIVTR